MRYLQRPVGHAIARLERSRRGRDPERRFVCSCGSRGQWRATAAAALVEFRAHAGIRLGVPRRDAARG